LAESRAQVSVILGDGRLSLTRAKDGVFSLIVLDAFSSDAIPVHLLTREALALYLRKLAPRGVLAFHLSNRHLNLEPVLSRLAEDAGVSARIRAKMSHIQEHSGEDASVWAVLAPDSLALGGLAQDPGWRALKQLHRMDTWTDDYSNVLRVLKLGAPF
jgi:spermidine synthase